MFRNRSECHTKKQGGEGTMILYNIQDVLRWIEIGVQWRDIKAIFSVLNIKTERKEFHIRCSIDYLKICQTCLNKSSITDSRVTVKQKFLNRGC